MKCWKCQQIQRADWNKTNIWYAARFISSFMIGTVCLCSDYLITKSTTESHLRLALLDNITHGLVGLFVALVIISYFHNHFTPLKLVITLGFAYLLSSLVDLDHFIEARSLCLEAATSLSHRPFLHNTTIIIILFVCVVIFQRRNQRFVSKLPFLIAITGIFVHHTRDAVRHGYWLYPFGSSPILPYPVYILISIVTPNLYYLVQINQNYELLSSDDLILV